MLKNRFKNKIDHWFIFGAYLAITFVASIYHQPWRDEAQSWLISRDLNIINIFKQMPYEGTPPLWHLILHPFASLGLPYSFEFILNYLIAAGAVFLLLFFSSLPKSIKYLLPFGFFFLFEYSVVARNYSLIIFVLFLVANFYRDRFKRPIIYSLLIALLAWTGIQTLGICAILSLFFILESLQEKHDAKKYLFAIIIMILAQISVIFILLPYPGQLYSSLTFPTTGITILARAATIALLPYLSVAYIPNFYFWIFLLIWPIIIIFLLKTRKAKVIFLASSAWMLFILLFMYSGYLRHYGLILMTFVFAWWLDNYYQKTEKTSKKFGKFIAAALLIFCLSGSVIYSAYYYYSNRNKNYSGAHEMANYLSANNLKNEEIVSFPAYAGSALLPYLPGKEFYQMEEERLGTYMTWDYKSKYGPLLPYEFLRNNLISHYRQLENAPKSLVIISVWPLDKYDPSLTFITKNTKPSVTDEYFYLYRLNLQN